MQIVLSFSAANKPIIFRRNHIGRLAIILLERNKKALSHFNFPLLFQKKTKANMIKSVGKKNIKNKKNENEK